MAGGNDRNSDAVGLEGLFARQASGLVRELGVREAFSINMGAVVLLAAPLWLIGAVTLFPQANPILPIVVGLLVSIALMFVYAALVAAFPRSGGDYVFAGRLFHPIVGATIGGALLVAMCVSIAITPVFLATQAAGFFFTAIGSAFDSTGISNVAGELGAHGVQFAIAAGTMLVVFVIVGLRTRITMRLLFWGGFVVSLVTMIILTVLLLFHGHDDFVRGYDAMAGHTGAYDDVLAAADKAGIQTGTTTSGTLSAVPYGVLLFLGFAFASFAGGEIRRPGKTQLWAGIAAIGITAIVDIIYWLSLRHAVGLHFIQASAGLASENPAAFEGATSVPSFLPTYSLVLSGDPVTKILLGCGLIVGFAVPVAGYVIAISRLLFALGFDRLVPQVVTNVNERTHSPLVASTIAVLGITVFCALAIFSNSAFALFRNATLIFTALYVVASIGAAILPYRGRAFYANAPKVLGNVGSVPLITVLGVVSAAVNILFVYLDITKPQISGGFSTSSIITLIATFTVGIVAFATSRFVQARRGLDLSLAMKELPPE